jgi:nucleoside-diphosphate-sugar epimerase
VRRVVYASSAAVFGPEEFYGHTTVSEGAALLPGTHYGVFKQCNEGNARVYYANDGICSLGLRPWAVYGVGRDQGITSGPTKAIKAAVVGQPYTIRFTGGLDLQYVNDTAQIFLHCAESDLDGAKVYNMRGSVTQTSEFIAALSRIVPRARDLIRAEGNALPIAYDLDDSALVRDLREVPRTAPKATPCLSLTTLMTAHWYAICARYRVHLSIRVSARPSQSLNVCTTKEDWTPRIWRPDQFV